MEDQSDGDADGVRRGTVGTEANIVELRPQTDAVVIANGQIGTAADAVSKGVGSRASKAGSERRVEVRTAEEGLKERRHFARIAIGEARAESVCGRGKAYAGRRAVVVAEVTDEAEPLVGVIRNGAANAIQIRAV